MYIFGRYLIMYVIESILKINFKNLYLKNINKIWNIEIDVCAMLKTKYGVNKMYYIIFSQQVGWFDSKRVNIHSWGSRIKLHKW
jgi:hypothetical protein